MGLKQAIEWMTDGRVDAQENPLANTVTYGAHKLHRFHTLTGHFYISRPIFLNRTAFDSWPQDLQDAMRAAVKDAVAQQRELAVAEEEISRQAILAQGCELDEMGADERRSFAAAVRPVYDELRAQLGKDTFGVLEQVGAAAVA
jgi:TRAP-type C4-dicarboxylate transport system substrate-binding protein